MREKFSEVFLNNKYSTAYINRLRKAIERAEITNAIKK